MKFCKDCGTVLFYLHLVVLLCKCLALSSIFRQSQARGITSTLYNGEAPLAGSFRMKFRGQDHVWDGKATGLNTAVGGDRFKTLTSPLIPWNATAAQMKTALELMGAVENVEVTRSDPGAASAGMTTGAFSWTVTFKTGTGTRAGWDAVRYKTPYGLRLDNVGNLRAMEVDMARLAGTGRKVHVGYLYNTSRTPNPWDAKALGSKGESAGSVYIFKRVERRYVEELKIRGIHTDSYDLFGFDTALWRHTLAVGAPRAEFRGYQETQSLVCSADAGAFTLSFLGHTTSPIVFNATGNMLKHALEKLQPIVEVSIEVWQSAMVLSNTNESICTNATVDDAAARVILVTFIAPDRGDVPSMEPDVDHRTRVNSPTQSNLVGWATLRRGDGNGPLSGTGLGSKNGLHGFGRVVVQDNVVRGTDSLSGHSAVGINTGVVYIFRRESSGNDEWNWMEEARVQPSNGVKSAGAQFGYSIAMTGPDVADFTTRETELAQPYTLVVGAPEDDVAGDGAGTVYVFRSKMQCLHPCRAGICCKRLWNEIQKITIRDMVCGLSPLAPLARPFRCNLDATFGSLPAHRFGHTVSISSDAGTLAIGELHQRTSMVDLNPGNESQSTSSSGVRIKTAESRSYVMRENIDLGGSQRVYIPDQILGAWDRQTYAPDGDEGFDDFGSSVSVDGNVLIVGAPGAFDVSTGTLRSGAAYAFKRLSERHSFQPELRMQPPDAVYNQRFGRGVRVTKTRLSYQALITAHEDYIGDLTVSEFFSPSALFSKILDVTCCKPRH